MCQPIGIVTRRGSEHHSAVRAGTSPRGVRLACTSCRRQALQGHQCLGTACLQHAAFVHHNDRCCHAHGRALVCHDDCHGVRRLAALGYFPTAFAESAAVGTSRPRSARQGGAGTGQATWRRGRAPAAMSTICRWDPLERIRSCEEGTRASECPHPRRPLRIHGQPSYTKMALLSKEFSLK